ncbi:hypothetical protein [Fusobacterium mortiferum]
MIVKTFPSIKYLLLNTQTLFSKKANGLSTNSSINNLSSGNTGRKSEAK